MASQRAALEIVRGYVKYLDSPETRGLRELRKRLLTINSFKKIHEMWEKAPYCSRRQQFIEKRIVEILSTIDSFKKLWKMWDDAPVGCCPQRLIEGRMMEILSTITSFEELLEIRDIMFLDSRPQHYVEERMAEVVQALRPAESIPKWFLELVRNSENIDYFLKFSLEKKVQEIVSHHQEPVSIT